MKGVKPFAIIVSLILLATLLTACATREPFDAGTPMSADDVAALREELLGKQENGNKEENNADTPKEDNTDTSVEDNTDTSQGATVYWLDNGSVYHTSASCYHIKEKPNVRSGAVADADAAGKTRLCSACARD